MKLLVITAVKAFEKDVKHLLKKSTIQSYSYMEVTGASQANQEPIEGNWFAHERHEQASVLFYVFVKKTFATKLFEEVTAFNDSQATMSKIHVAMLNIEKSNEQ